MKISEIVLEVIDAEYGDIQFQTGGDYIFDPKLKKARQLCGKCDGARAEYSPNSQRITGSGHLTGQVLNPGKICSNCDNTGFERGSEWFDAGGFFYDQSGIKGIESFAKEFPEIMNRILKGAESKKKGALNALDDLKNHGTLSKQDFETFNKLAQRELIAGDPVNAKIAAYVNAKDRNKKNWMNKPSENTVVHVVKVHNGKKWEDAFEGEKIAAEQFMKDHESSSNAPAKIIARTVKK